MINFLNDECTNSLLQELATVDSNASPAENQLPTSSMVPEDDPTSPSLVDDSVLGMRTHSKHLEIIQEWDFA